jgi:hypothetical protein
MITDESHPCVTPGCRNTVTFDDEPWCYTHSPDSGSDVPGYSYARSHIALDELRAKVYAQREGRVPRDLADFYAKLFAGEAES